MGTHFWKHIQLCTTDAANQTKCMWMDVRSDVSRGEIISFAATIPGWILQNGNS